MPALARPFPLPSALAAVRDAIVACERCPRLRQYCRQVADQKRRAYLDDTYWGRPVPGFGDPRARLLVLGLAPAAHGANRTGRVFTGDGIGGSGDVLMAALHANGFANIPTSRHAGDGLRLRDAWIAAAVRCAPPDNRPAPDELERCLEHLAHEVAGLTRVTVVVALGQIAFAAWLRLLARNGTGIRPRPQFAHGVVAAGAGATLVGCYHPSRQNTNTGRLTPAMISAVFATAKRLVERGGADGVTAARARPRLRGSRA
ncbi:MAG: uracil-DNA glycosylase [Acidimicrobiia bacterium]|nr:uracil-DNA glycosylase [Acidimicrobiia bacterium]